MTLDSVAPSERSLVRFATYYREVETQSISSLERAIVRELAQARLAAKRKKREGETRLVEATRFGGLGKSVSK